MAYAANLTWAPSVAGATYVADSALGLTRRTGRTLPVPAPAVDEAERDAVAAMVAAFVAATPTKTAKINIGWTENDYEIDIANASGRDEYKRIIRRSAQLGIDHVLFAPRNTDVSSRDRATDAWRWEEILWFGLGEAVRAGTWLPGVDPIPASLAEMLAYFREQKQTRRLRLPDPRLRSGRTARQYVAAALVDHQRLVFRRRRRRGCGKTTARFGRRWRRSSSSNTS